MNPVRILLIGGGHAHIEVIRQYPELFGELAVEMILVSPDPGSAYSGMLPGAVAGHYKVEDILINLPSLCEASGVRWLQGRFQALAEDQRSIILADGRVLAFDYISFDIGSVPSGLKNPHSAHSMGAKPVIPYLQAWERFLQGVCDDSSTRTVTVVGGGVAAFELALAMHHRIGTQQQGGRCAWQLISSGELLAGHNPLVRSKGRAVLKRAGFHCRTGVKVSAVEGQKLLLSDGQTLNSDFTVLCTPAMPVLDLSAAGMSVSEQGFLPVDEFLQIKGLHNGFAVGDIAQYPTPLAKAGVYAVRQGPVLAANLKSAVQGQPLKAFRPQRTFLKLITLGDQQAMASRGWFYCQGSWVWQWKHRIDTGFMEKYQR